MRELPTVVLHHVTSRGSHFDWMLADPAFAGRAAAGSLWTFRVEHHPAVWGDVGDLCLTPLPAHRGDYLDYEGRVSGDRGRVMRVARGWFVPRVWSVSRCIIDLRLAGGGARWQLIRLGAEAWRGSRLAGDGGRGMLRET